MQGDFDTVLELRDKNNNRLMYNDYFNGSYNHSQINIQLPYSGVYMVVAQGYGGSTGNYDLSFEGFSDQKLDEETLEEYRTTCSRW